MVITWLSSVITVKNHLKKETSPWWIKMNKKSGRLRSNQFENIELKKIVSQKEKEKMRNIFNDVDNSNMYSSHSNP